MRHAKKKGTLKLVAAMVAVLVGAAMTAWAVFGLSSRTDTSLSPLPSTAATAEPAVADKGVTLVLHATGTTGTLVTYTCVKGGKVSVCQKSINGLWAEKVTVPVGTTVMIQARGGIVPSICSITDESDRMVLNRNPEEGDCVWMVER